MPDGPTLEVLRARYGARYKWRVLQTLMIGAVSSIISSTIVNVAIPDLSRQFALGQERAQWVSASFMMAMTLAMLLTPWLLRRYGLRRTYIGTLLLLALGALVGGLAPSYEVLIAMRVAEGAAAGIIMPLPNILILRFFEPAEQGKAMGLFGFGVILAPALGPSVGGVLVEHFGWRSIFFVVLPFCLLGIVMARRLMAVNSPMIGESKPLDWRGLLLAGAATVSLLNGLATLQRSAATGAAMLLAGIGGLGLFVLRQSRVDNPLLHLGLYRYRQYAMGSLVAFIYGMGLYGSTYALPVYMQIALGYSPSAAGLIVAPPGLVLAVTIVFAGRLAGRVAPYRLVTFGLALLAGSFALMATNTLATGFALLIAWAVIGRIGLGFVLPSLALGAMRGVDPALIAEGSSAINFLRQLGGAIGISLIGIFLEWRLAAYGVDLRQASGDALARIRAFNETFVLMAGLCAAALLAAWRMRPARPEIRS